MFLSRLRLPLLKKLYVNTFPAVHLKKMDAWDYMWHFSSELLVASLVLVVAVFHFFAFTDDHVNDKSLANTFLGYHVAQNPALYAHSASTKTQVIQKSGFVQEAFASDINENSSAAVEQPDIVASENALVAQNPDSVSELLKKQVKVYTTKPNDTLGSISQEFKISVDTLKWANNLNSDTIQPGWHLVILPVNGLLIKAGPNTTLPDIASKYKGSLERIIAYNGLANAEDITEGDYIICEGCQIVPPPQPTPPPVQTSKYGIADEAVPNPYKGKGHIFPKGYCTYYVSTRMKITFGGNAKAWLANGRAAGYKTGTAPMVGSAVVTTDNAYYGHVAYVEQVTATHIVVSEMNYERFNKVNKRSIPINSKTIRGYVYPL